MPRKPQPVPPIFQPEVAADAIVWARTTGAASTRRLADRKAVVGNKIAPGFADRYLARHGFADQQTDEPEDPDRPDNLFEPVPGDFGAHGRFDRRRAHGRARSSV